MDIVRRLRKQFTVWNNPPSPELPDGAMVLLEAATEIEQLRTIFRVNILRLAPQTSHAEIDELLDQR